jgi:hypothetical protein
MRILFASALIGASFHAVAASGLTTHTEPTEFKGATISYYAPECGEESWAECVKADLKCSSPGEFSASANDFTNEEIATWLHSDKAVSKLVIDGKAFSLNPTKIIMSDLNGTWDIDFYNNSESDAVWRALKSAHTIRIVVGSRTVTMTPDRNLAATVGICAKRLDGK